MDKFLSLLLIFPLIITLHNLEEALWLPQWSQHAKRYHKPVKRNEFYFAVLIITILAYIVTFLFVFFNNISVFKFIYFGFVGTMILNAVFPHLAATIVLKRYAPGVISGIFLNVPFLGLLIHYSINEQVISLVQVIISTIIVGVIILGLLPVLFKLGEKLTSFTQD